MPVPVACSCGKQLRVADEHRGKRIKCPGCGDPLTVPGGSSKSQPAEMIRFECECGKLLQARPETAGKMTRCPDCGAKQEIPDLEEAESREVKGRIEAERPRPKKAVVEADEEEEERPRRLKRDEEDEEAEEDRPRKRSKKKQRKDRKWPLVVALVTVLLLLLGGGGFAAFWFLRGGPSAGEAEFLPADAQGLVAIRVAELSKHEALKKAMQGMGGNNPLDEPSMGLTAADVERMTWVLHDGTQTPPLWWAVIVTAKPYDQKKVLNSLSNNRAVKHEGRTFHVGQATMPARQMPGAMPPGLPGGRMGGMPGAPATEQVAVYFAGKTLLVVAQGESAMQRTLTLAARKNVTGPLADAVRQVSGPRHFFGAFALPPSAQETLKGQAGVLPPNMKMAGPLMGFTGGSLAIDYRSNVSVELTLKYPDDKRAGEARTGIEGLLTFASLALLQVPDKDTQAALQDALKKVKPEQRGVEVSVKIEVPAQTLEGLANKAMPPGGFPGR